MMVEADLEAVDVCAIARVERERRAVANVSSEGNILKMCEILTSEWQ